MDENSIRNELRNHALKFHQALVDGKICIKQIDPEDFLTRIADDLSLTTKYVMQKNDELEFYKLSMPVIFLYNLQDILAFSNWDYEFCYDGFFNDLNQLFSQTKHKSEWAYDAKLLQLKYSLDEQVLIFENLALNDEVDPIVYDNILRLVNETLKEQGEILYEATTGDQTGLLVLMPVNAQNLIKDYLISVSDPRAQLFYE
jgi:hypothetical protein